MLTSPDDPPPLHASQVHVLDLGTYLDNGAGAAALAQQLSDACEEMGFFFIVNHGAQSTVDTAFRASRAFHALPLADKSAIPIDRTGSGYLQVNQKILPPREKGNLNTAFMMLNDAGHSSLNWPNEGALPGFRQTFDEWTQGMERMSRLLLPLFARALGQPNNVFEEAFQQPLSYSRMSYYPSSEVLHAQGVFPDADQFGVTPHVDITFFTISDCTDPGLCVWNEDAWRAVPVVPGALLVLCGACLQRWTNDRFLAPAHHVKTTRETDRYSCLYFIYPTVDVVMSCLPGCSGPGNPAKYPDQTYKQSQTAYLTGFSRTVKHRLA